MSRFQKIRAGDAGLTGAAERVVGVLHTASNLIGSPAESREVTWTEAVEIMKRAGSADRAERLAALKDLFGDAAEDMAAFEGWRLPSVEDLFPFADRSRHSPAIDTEFFPNCKSDWYWTSTPAACSPSGYAWDVDFDLGSAAWDDQDFSGFVRAVRPGQ